MHAKDFKRKWRSSCAAVVLRHDTLILRGSLPLAPQDDGGDMGQVNVILRSRGAASRRMCDPRGPELWSSSHILWKNQIHANCSNRWPQRSTYKRVVQ
jgi:hypothetical protein